MNKRKIVIISSIIVLVLIISGSVIVIVLVQKNDDSGTVLSNAEINVLKDSDFTNYNFTGTGSANDPYLIKSLSFNTTKKYGIFIKSTSKHFVISNCTITSNLSAIKIVEIADYTCTITNNTLIQKDCNGLSAEHANGIIITNNLIYQEQKNPSPYVGGSGIYVSWSDSILITNNTIRNMRFGIYTGLNSGNISNNYIYNCNRGIKNTSIGSLIINNNTCLFGDYGLDLYALQMSIIKFNVVLNTSFYGFYILNCDLSTFAYNNISFCERYGIYQEARYPDHPLTDFYRNVFFSNNLFRNNFEQTLLGSSQAYDESFETIWYNGTLLQGNYWSDLNWESGITYHIDGEGNHTDLYPLETPVTF